MGFDPVSYTLGRRAGQAEADPLKSWSELQLWLRAGQLGQVLEPGDQLNVAMGSTVRDFDVLGLDEDEAVGANLTHALSIQSHDVLSTVPFDPPMYLFAVTEEACEHYGWPSTGADAGMPAGTYNIMLLRGAYNADTSQDGTYQFTTTQIVPVGGGIRHTQMGVYRSDGQYTKANLLAGTFTTYGADTFTTIETDLLTSEGSGGVSLGTTTARDPQYKSGDYINFTQRQGHGSGRLSWSYLWQYLNSDDAVFQWQPKSIWSRNVSSSSEGFLHSIDPALRQVIGKVRKRVVLSIADGGGYEDLEGFCFPSFLVDVGFGANGSVYEGPVDESGTVTRTEAYTFWKDAGNADRIKNNAESVTVGWWLGSPATTGIESVRFVSTIGTRDGNRANRSYGVVPSLFVV
ncbi:MAG: hypothetical protein IKP82_02090 [Oscillospiraceae bacterium]|nr:hypothetical protein [Oscillospiraceae bacterium]